LIDECLAFVRDPRGSRTEHAVVAEYPTMIPVLELMILDGVTERVDVAAYVHPELSAEPLQD